MSASSKLVLLFAALQTTPGKGFLAATLSDRLSATGGRNVTFEGIRARLLLDLPPNPL